MNKLLKNSSKYHKLNIFFTLYLLLLSNQVESSNHIEYVQRLDMEILRVRNLQLSTTIKELQQENAELHKKITALTQYLHKRLNKSILKPHCIIKSPSKTNDTSSSSISNIAIDESSITPRSF